MEAHLLYCIRDVRSGEGEVLESTRKAPVGGGVGDGGAGVGGSLGLRVHRRGAGLAVGHARTLKDVEGVLALLQEEPLGSVLHGDPQEVVKLAQILNDELSLESGDGVLKELGGGGGEDDVVDVQ